jgi:hypothetical protein
MRRRRRSYSASVPSMTKRASGMHCHPPSARQSRIASVVVFIRLHASLLSSRWRSRQEKWPSQEWHTRRVGVKIFRLCVVVPSPPPLIPWLLVSTVGCQDADSAAKQREADIGDSELQITGVVFCRSLGTSLLAKDGRIFLILIPHYENSKIIPYQSIRC